jgi:hypothetical protein
MAAKNQRTTKNQVDATDGEKLTHLLRNQCLMVSYIGRRLEVVNYIVKGYKKKTLALRGNTFIYESARVIYSSIITDVAGLYGPPTKISKNSFLGTKEMVSPIAEKEDLTQLKVWLDGNMFKIRCVRQLLKYELNSKYYLKNSNIYADFKGLFLINTLHQLAVKIVGYYSQIGIIEDSNSNHSAGDYQDYLMGLIELL